MRCPGFHRGSFSALHGLSDKIPGAACRSPMADPAVPRRKTAVRRVSYTGASSPTSSFCTLLTRSLTGVIVSPLV